MAAKSKARYVFPGNEAWIFQCSISLINIRTIIVRMLSTAQSGYFYTTQRLRQGPSLAAVKYDPRGVYKARQSI